MEMKDIDENVQNPLNDPHLCISQMLEDIFLLDMANFLNLLIPGYL